MKHPSRYWLATVLFFIHMPFHSACFGQVMTARFKSIVANSNAYYEYLPKGYNPNDTVKYPLMVYIHGAGDLGNGTASTLPLMLRSGPPMEINQDSFPAQITVNGHTFGFIMIGPQWMVQPTNADVDNVINFAIANYKVDVTRIYLTGLSMGGGAPGSMRVVNLPSLTAWPPSFLSAAMSPPIKTGAVSSRHPISLYGRHTTTRIRKSPSLIRSRRSPISTNPLHPFRPRWRRSFTTTSTMPGPQPTRLPSASIT